MLTIAARTIPVLGRIKAGVPLLSEQHIVGEIEVPETIARQAEFALEVIGDSMIGAGLQAGDYVFMATANRRAPSHGDIVAAMVGDEMTLKRYVKRSGHFWLHAENGNYPDIPVDNQVTIQGVYVGRFSEYQGNVDPPVEELTEGDLINRLAQKYKMDPNALQAMLKAARALKG